MRQKKFSIFLVIVMAFTACKKPHGIPPYTISKIFKTDTATVVNVHIGKRLTIAELLSVAGKLRSNSVTIKNLAVHYLLPGNADISAGDHSYFASARLIKENDVKPTDTLKDDDGNVFRIQVFGLSQDQARKLLTIEPQETAGKNILGRFIDDYSHTVIIPFKDAADKKDDVYIVEVDSAGNIVSKTIPRKISDGGVEKWLVTQNGDYMTLKNNVLSQYAADGLGVPFNSIKSGI